MVDGGVAAQKIGSLTLAYIPPKKVIPPPKKIRPPLKKDPPSDFSAKKKALRRRPKSQQGLEERQLTNQERKRNL